MTQFRSSLEFSKIYYDALIYNLKCQHFLLSFKWRDILVMDSEYNKAYRLLYMTLPITDFGLKYNTKY